MLDILFKSLCFFSNHDHATPVIINEQIIYFSVLFMLYFCRHDFYVICIYKSSQSTCLDLLCCFMVLLIIKISFNITLKQQLR